VDCSCGENQQKLSHIRDHLVAVFRNQAADALRYGRASRFSGNQYLVAGIFKGGDEVADIG
jgi:hypothetical protein